MTRADKIKALEIDIHNLEVEFSNKKNQLGNIKSAIPEGYELVNPGEVVKPGALGYEPCHGNWDKAYNCVGCKVNAQGYVSEYVHRGWKFANPINS